MVKKREKSHIFWVKTISVSLGIHLNPKTRRIEAFLAVQSHSGINGLFAAILGFQKWFPSSKNCQNRYFTTQKHAKSPYDGVGFEFRKHFQTDAPQPHLVGCS
jgi:hypothetical protein